MKDFAITWMNGPSFLQRPLDGQKLRSRDHPPILLEEVQSHETLNTPVSSATEKNTTPETSPSCFGEEKAREQKVTYLPTICHRFHLMFAGAKEAAQTSPFYSIDEP